MVSNPSVKADGYDKRIITLGNTITYAYAVPSPKRSCSRLCPSGQKLTSSGKALKYGNSLIPMIIRFYIQVNTMVPICFYGSIITLLVR